MVAAGLVLAASAVMAVLPQVPGGDPNDCVLDRSLTPPTFPEHVFGFDLQGCDLLSLTIAGTRNSLLVGVLASMFAIVAAIPVGTAAGFTGGWLDALVGRLVDLVTALPVILIGLVILSAIDERGVLLVAIVMAVAAWPIYTRVDPGGHIPGVRTVARRRGQSVGGVVAPPGSPTCNAGFRGLARRGDSVDDRLLDRHRGLAELPRSGAPATRRLVGCFAGEAQRYIRQAPHLMLPGLFLLLVTGALVVVGEATRSRTRD